jgi:hypothetical protein
VPLLVLGSVSCVLGVVGFITLSGPESFGATEAQGGWEEQFRGETVVVLVLWGFLLASLALDLVVMCNPMG